MAPQALSTTSSSDQAPDKASIDPSATPGMPEWSPNFKFKVMDKEHEIPEGWRSLVKDAKTEKEAKEIFEKAYGLDFVKPKYQESRQKLQEVQGEHAKVLDSINQARQHYQKSDFEQLFSHLNIDENKVLQYFINKAKMMELPPEQQAAIQGKREAERRAEIASQQAQQAQTHQVKELENLTQELFDAELERPGVKDFISQFDARLGKEGAFVEEVIRRGNFYWEKDGRYVPPSKVVPEVLRLAGFSANAPVGAQAAGAVAAATQSPQTKVIQPPASIPAISGRSTAPMPQKPKSIEDLENIRKKKYGS